jgi:drug/metabolite transporter (DMT)-like permease
MLAALMVGNGLVLPAAYQSAPSIIIATFDYTYLIFATLLGAVLFSEIPDLQTVLGIVVIAGAGLIVAR